MTFYALSKTERVKTVERIRKALELDLQLQHDKSFLLYFDDADTYIRKAAYLSVGKIFKHRVDVQKKVLQMLVLLLQHDSFRIRQTSINAAGEIGITDFEVVQPLFDTGLFDIHHSPRNAVIGSIKKMGEVNPTPVLTWCRQYLHHPDREIRREICHGIELRGRKHPEDILPMLKELQFDKTARVRNTVVHVLGQIAYKKGCLQKVVEDLKSWENEELVKQALAEIIEVHGRYKDFAVLTQDEAINYIDVQFGETKKNNKD